ncbi:MAG TPA: DUF6427 family protein [Cyclobacteriaceae bacterium]|nr:DUF6427 family protein [Cyclobacteriaceae bacterium]
MLRFFRFNDPYRLLVVLILMVGMSMPIFIHPMPMTGQELKDIVLGELLNSGKTMYMQVVDDSPWVAAWFAKVIELILGRSVFGRHFLALLITFFQAAFFAFILIRNRAYNESNYLPAFVFGVICFFSFDMLSLSRELFASTFLLLAVNNIFKEIEFKVQRDEIVFNIGFFLGIASLFIFSYTIFLVGSLVILFAYARITFRKSLLLTFGFAFPHLALISVYYFRDGLSDFVQDFYGPNLTFHSIDLISWKSMLWLSGAILTFLFFALIMLNREARFTKYQSQLLQVMLLWLVVSFIEIAFTRELTPHSFITFVPPLAYFISHYILLIRRKWIAESMMWIFLLLTIAISTASRLNKIKQVDYAGLYPTPSKYESFIKGKKVLVLENDLGIYKNNKPASYFLNWNLSKEILEGPDYFENVILVQDSFEKDKPDIIIDEKDLMKKFFERLPEVKKEYERSGFIYIKKVVLKH